MRYVTLFLLSCTLFLGACARSAPQLEPLIEAAGKGDDQTVKAMLAKNPELAKASRADGYTALHEAIMQSRDGLVPILLEAGANPNQVKGNGNQPIHAAVHKLKPETIALLIDKGAQINGRAPNGDTALIIAAGLQRAEVVKVLLDKGADPNLQNTDAKSPGAFALLHAAGGEAEIVKLLLAKGAKTDLAMKDGTTALHVAVGTSRQALVKDLLQKGAPVNAQNQMGQTPLTVAVANGQLTMIDVLLAAGADPKVGSTMQAAQGKKDIQARLKKAAK